MSHLRAPTEADVPEIARIASEHWPEPTDADLVRRWWSAPGFDRELDACIEPGAYAHVLAFDETRAWIDLRGQPSPALLDWAEGRAGERGDRVLTGAWMPAEKLRDDLRDRGFTPIRHAFRMSIDLDDASVQPVWPDGIRPRTYGDGDARRFYDAGNDTFEDTWEPIVPSFEEWSHSVLERPSFDPSLWFLAEDGAEVAGFAICRIHEVDRTLGWVHFLGVRKPWRGRGVGRALLLTALETFRSRGLSRASLGVDAENPTGATRLYESVGMRVSADFDIYEKVQP